MIRVKSFDIFDTLLTRQVGEPSSLFLWLGKRFLIDGIITVSPIAFSQARIEAERRARLHTPSREVTLNAIYREFLDSGLFEDKHLQRIVDAELDLERKMIRLIPGAVDRVANARKTAARIAFLSDMYLPSTFLIELLHKHGIWNDTDLCLVSGEKAASKANGKLFQCLAHETGVHKHEIEHVGNHLFFDVKSAQKENVHAIYAPDGNLNRYEKILEKYAAMTDGWSSLLAGASRIARLEDNTTVRREQLLRQVATGVAAPTLIAWVAWILQQAHKRGLSALYFVSRDGQILIEIAKRLATKLNIPIELRYLYGSRQAWHLPAIQDEKDDSFLSWVLTDTTYLSIKSVLARVCIAPEEIESSLKAFAFHRVMWQRNLNTFERQQLRNLFDHPDVRQAILKRAAEKRILAEDYLKQEDVVRRDKWGLVDVGWHGRVQDSLAKLVNIAGGMPPHGFYFGLCRDVIDSRLGLREAYMFHNAQKRGYLPRSNHIYTLIEVFCSADHGGVAGYEKIEGNVYPVLRSQAVGELINWGLREVHRAILQTVEAFPADSELLSTPVEFRPLISELLETFWRRPENDESAVWGTFPYEDDQTGEYTRKLAEPYSLGQIASIVRLDDLPLHHNNAWPSGSLDITPWPIRRCIQLAEKARRLASSLVNRINK